MFATIKKKEAIFDVRIVVIMRNANMNYIQFVHFLPISNKSFDNRFQIFLFQALFWLNCIA